MSNYYTEQFGPILDEKMTYPIRIKVLGETTETNYIDLNKFSIPMIRGFLDIIEATLDEDALSRQDTEAILIIQNSDNQDAAVETLNARFGGDATFNLNVWAALGKLAGKLQEDEPEPSDDLIAIRQLNHLLVNHAYLSDMGISQRIQAIIATLDR
ncbi:MAG: hypothetical protein KAS32_24805 [Candidatus Peribacteraceae bacterium]|nr:hypothetical protein [Candidatus Peribacteraceae bacterium]